MPRMRRSLDLLGAYSRFLCHAVIRSAEERAARFHLLFFHLRPGSGRKLLMVPPTTTIFQSPVSYCLSLFLGLQLMSASFDRFRRVVFSTTSRHRPSFDELPQSLSSSLLLLSDSQFGFVFPLPHRLPPAFRGSL